MGTFCCHGNQTKRQIIIILAILNSPYPSNSHNASVVLEEMSFNFFFFFEFNVAMETQHTNWADNHPMITTAKYGLHHFTGYGENAI